MRIRISLALLGVACFATWVLGQSCSVQVFFASPEAGDSAKLALLQSLDGARESLEIAVGSFTDDDLGDAVVRAHRRGVSVRVILASGRQNEIGGEFDKLQSAGVAVRLSDGPAAFDHRFAIVDGRIILTGAYEWSGESAFGSVVRVTCASSSAVARPFVGEFERLWARWADTVSGAAEAESPISSVSILSVDSGSQCIHLLNTSDREVDISHWSLSDLEGRYTFPQGTVLPPHDPLSICIGQFNPAEDVDALYLDPGGDEVFLASPEGTIVDEMVW